MTLQMSPDLTSIQLISIGIAVTAATSFINSLPPHPHLHSGDMQSPMTNWIPSTRKDPTTQLPNNSPSPHTMLFPQFQQRPIIRTDLASVTTTTHTHTIHQHTTTVRSTSLRQVPHESGGFSHKTQPWGPSGQCRTPTMTQTTPQGYGIQEDRECLLAEIEWGLTGNLYSTTTTPVTLILMPHPHTSQGRHWQYQ